MKKDIVYNGKTISLIATLNSGHNVVDDGKGNQRQVLTHTLEIDIDTDMFVQYSGLSDADLIQKINDGTRLAQQRIDIIDTTQDSPVVNSLVGLGFSF